MCRCADFKCADDEEVNGCEDDEAVVGVLVLIGEIIKITAICAIKKARPNQSTIPRIS